MSLIQKPLSWVRVNFKAVILVCLGIIVGVSALIFAFVTDHWISSELSESNHKLNTSLNASNLSLESFKIASTEAEQELNVQLAGIVVPSPVFRRLDRLGIAREFTDAAIALCDSKRREFWLSLSMRQADREECVVKPPLTKKGYELLNGLDKTLIKRLLEYQRKHPEKPIADIILEEVKLLDLQRAINQWNKKHKGQYVSLKLVLGVIYALLGGTY